jgi:hypothetical protein
VALCASAVANPLVGSAPLTAALFLALWAAMAPPLGAFAEAKTLKEALTTPALQLVPVIVGVVCLLSAPIQGQAPTAQSWLTVVLVTSVLIECSRLAVFALHKTDRALNAFVLAVKDEDAGDDDF